MSKLPENWVEVSLSEISTVEMGQSPDSSTYNDQGQGLPFFQGKAEFGKLYPTVRKWCTDPKKVAEPGDILLSVRAPVGPTNLALEKSCIGRGLASIQAYEPIYQKYLLHYFRNIEPWLSQQGTGTTFTAISGSFIRDLHVPVAPLNEQKRIAEKLDTLLARVDSCQSHLERVPQILKRFRQSVLAAATSGRLTEDWRKEKGVSDEWETVQLSEVANSRLGKMLDAAKNRGELHPYLRNINVRWFAFDLSDIQELKISEEEAKTLGVRKGDVLVCEGGEPGRCAVWNGEDDVYLFQKALHRVRVSEKLLPQWLCYCLKSSADSRKLADYFTGTTIKHFTGVSLSRFEFDLPSLEEQAKIVRRVESLFAYADHLEARYTSANEHVERLTPSLLAKAFRGELVEQDPNDEPAAAFLERIKVAKGNTPIKRMKPERRSAVTNTPQKRGDKRISVVQALKEAGRVLSTEQLFAAAGFPADAPPALVEEFFVEIRTALENNQLQREREHNQDWFSVSE